MPILIRGHTSAVSGCGPCWQVWLSNSEEWVVCMLGCAFAGVTLAPLAVELRAREAAQALALCEAKGLIMHAHFGRVDYVALFDEAAPGFRSFGRCAALPALQVGVLTFDRLHLVFIHLVFV